MSCYASIKPKQRVIILLTPLYIMKAPSQFTQWISYSTADIADNETCTGEAVGGPEYIRYSTAESASLREHRLV